MKYHVPMLSYSASSANCSLDINGTIGGRISTRMQTFRYARNSRGWRLVDCVSQLSHYANNCRDAHVNTYLFSATKFNAVAYVRRYCRYGQKVSLRMRSEQKIALASTLLFQLPFYTRHRNFSENEGIIMQFSRRARPTFPRIRCYLFLFSLARA